MWASARPPSTLALWNRCIQKQVSIELDRDATERDRRARDERTTDSDDKKRSIRTVQVDAEGMEEINSILITALMIC